MSTREGRVKVKRKTNGSTNVNNRGRPKISEISNNNSKISTKTVSPRSNRASSPEVVRTLQAESDKKPYQRTVHKDEILRVKMPSPRETTGRKGGKVLVTTPRGNKLKIDNNQNSPGRYVPPKRNRGKQPGRKSKYRSRQVEDPLGSPKPIRSDRRFRNQLRSPRRGKSRSPQRSPQRSPPNRNIYKSSGSTSPKRNKSPKYKFKDTKPTPIPVSSPPRSSKNTNDQSSPPRRSRGDKGNTNKGVIRINQRSRDSESPRSSSPPARRTRKTIRDTRGYRSPPKRPVIRNRTRAK